MTRKGKRFSKKPKKFHYATRETRYTFKGREAEDEMLIILRGNADAQNLAKEVVSFYGNYLEFYENKSSAGSRFEIGWGHKPVKLRFAAVHLKLGTNRTAEALAHELLHLRLLIYGFPSFEQVSIPEELEKNANNIINIIKIIANLVGHELTFPQFAKFGFESSKFLGPPSPSLNYEEHAREAIQSQGSPSAIGFPWWCLEYYRHWVSARHGVGKEVLQFAETIEHWGSKAYSELPKTFCMMRDWTSRGEFRECGKYPAEFNKHLSIVKLPQVTGWAVLKINEPGKPFAVNL